MIKGGAKNTVPFPATFEEALELWDFFYVTSHGLFEDKLMIVPENTYIINMATAGKSCMKFDKVLEGYVFENEGGEGDLTGLREMYDAIKAKTFLRDLERGEHIYSPGTVAKNEEELYANDGAADPAMALAAAGAGAGTAVLPATMSLSFYEPGDIMFDTKLVTKNDMLPLILLGVYRFPVPFSIRQQIFDVNKPVLKPGAKVKSLNTVNIRTDLPANSALWKPKEADHQIFNTDINLIREKMFPAHGRPIDKMYLSDVINHVNSTNDDGKKHFFMINACRSTEDIHMAKTARRYSIAARGERLRVNLNEELLRKYPEKRFRSVLNRAFLQRYLNALPGEKVFQQGNLAALRANKSKAKTPVERYKFALEVEELEFSIANIDAAILFLNQILTDEDAVFTTRQLKSALIAGKRLLQPELKKLLNIA